MRTLIWIAASAALAASCGKQLNPEYCAAHPTDVDCQNAGEVVIDAPAPCTSNAMCATGVCDTKVGQCVECTVAMNVCTGGTPVCDVDDHCHECTASNPMKCGAMGVCLPDDTCATTDSFLYASPNGTGNMCSMPMPCDLGTAVGKLDAAHRVISLSATTAQHYMAGALTIGANAVIFGDASRMVTGPADAVVEGSITVGSGITVALDNLSVTNSPGTGVACSTGTLTFHYSNSFNNAGPGIQATSGCTLNVDRAEIYANQGGGLLADASAVNVFNVFIDGNSGGQAVRLSGGVTGSFNYSSIGYNNIKKNTDAVSCQGSASFAFNIVAGDNLSDGEGNGAEFSNNGCSTNQDIITNDASGLYTSSTDLHLMAGAQAIDQIDPTECIQNDIDGEARPKGPKCDIGADEY